MTTTFTDFALAPDLLRGLEALGFTTPTPVQEQAIPLLLAKRDAIVMAKTGSGKTFAFGLPIMTMLKRGPRPQALVVVPTRELAQQIREALESVSRGTSLRTLVVYGGVGIGPQEAALRAGADLIVGTPGRLKDLLNRGSLDLGAVSILVLDEADEMLDKGFRREIEYLLGRLPSRQQTLIFSATMPQEIELIARQHLKDPAMVKLTREQAVPTEIEHQYVRVPSDMRLDALVALLKQEDPERALIFTRTKRETKILARKLEAQAGLVAGFLNGNMSQNARNTMMAGFRAGEFRYLVATDVAARGLDVEGLSHVFHFAVPTVVETYIHRSGRTGRAGNEGKTVILVTPDDESDFRAISKRIRIAEMIIEVPRLPRPDGVPVSRGPRTQRSLDPSLEDAQTSSSPPPQHRRGRPAPAAHVPAPRRDRPAPSASPTPHRGGDAHRGEAPRGGERPALTPARPAVQPARPAGASIWRAFKLPLRPGHDHSPDSFRSWLAQRTRVAATQLRAVKLHAEYATFEVEAPAVDKFLALLRTPSH